MIYNYIIYRIYDIIVHMIYNAIYDNCIIYHLIIMLYITWINYM